MGAVGLYLHPGILFISRGCVRTEVKSSVTLGGHLSWEGDRIRQNQRWPFRSWKNL